MKCSEFHRFVKKQGWVKKRQKGSHIIYEKPGTPRTASVPFLPGEIPEPLRLKLIKEMGLK